MLLRRPKVGVRLRYRREGEVRIRDGRIAGGDLLSEGSLRAFSQRVAPGTYPVETVYAETTRDAVAAFGVIRLVNETANKCRLALFEGEDPAEMTDDMGGGLGTDSGTIALGEAEVEGAAVTDEDLAAFRDRVGDGFGDESGCQVVPSPRGANVCVWASGFGDGMYTPYWGVRRDGPLCFLAVDFGVVANGLRARAVRWPSVGDSLALEPKSWWHRFWKR